MMVIINNNYNNHNNNQELLYPVHVLPHLVKILLYLIY